MVALVGTSNSKVTAMAVDVRNDVFKIPFLCHHQELTPSVLLSLVQMAKRNMLKHIPTVWHARGDVFSHGLRRLYKKFQRGCDRVLVRIRESHLEPDDSLQTLSKHSDQRELEGLIYAAWGCGSRAVNVEILHAIGNSLDSIILFYGGVNHCKRIANVLQFGLDGRAYQTKEFQEK
jgi:hypothetical protein